MHDDLCPLSESYKHWQGAVVCLCELISLVREDQIVKDIDLKLAETNMVDHFEKRLTIAYKEGAMFAQQAMIKLLQEDYDDEE